jgi:hypothetical protein
VVDWFLAINDRWFNDTANEFYGKRDRARRYLIRWADDGKLGTANDVLEITLQAKFNEWLESSWAIKDSGRWP